MPHCTRPYIVLAITALQSEGEVMQDTMQQMMSMMKELKSKSVDHDAMLKDLLSETKEMKGTVDATADAQQQIIANDETNGPVPAASEPKRDTMPSPVPMRSLVPAFMRSTSFRRGSTGTFSTWHIGD